MSGTGQVLHTELMHYLMRYHLLAHKPLPNSDLHKPRGPCYLLLFCQFRVIEIHSEALRLRVSLSYGAFCTSLMIGFFLSQTFFVTQFAERSPLQSFPSATLISLPSAFLLSSATLLSAH